jgi:hypothetical protein
MAGSRRDELCDQLNSAGNRGKGNRVNVSNGSSQSARKNTASVSAELIANSTTSSLSRARDMICNANSIAVRGLNLLLLLHGRPDLLGVLAIIRQPQPRGSKRARHL